MSDITETKNVADLVVYGKIFTSEGDNIVEAFAVKDGRYIYAGDKKGAAAFVEEGTTQVIDHTGKGLVMPSCGNGHAHYSMGYAIKSVGAVVTEQDGPEKFLNEILPASVKKARENGATALFGFGWNLMAFQDNMPTRQQIDEICSDIPIYFADEEGHKGLANTLCLVNAGIMKEDGTVLKQGKDIRGGEIVMGSDGTPTGYLKEQAGTYVRSFMDNENIFPTEIARLVLGKIQDHLLSEGYTMYLDGWGNYFYNENYFKAARQMDEAGDMHFILGTSYEMESWADVESALQKADEARRFASEHVKTNWVKIFIDGTVETGTGYVDPEYPDGRKGEPIWSEEEVTDITRTVNAKGMTMHVHVMGNMAVKLAVNAFANGGKDEMRNTLVHVHRANPEDLKQMADHDIYVVAGMHWHHSSTENIEYMRRTGAVPAGMEDKSYPIKSFFDHGINISSHSDFPALSGSPDDPFGIMQIAVTGVWNPKKEEPYWSEELVTREQALEALTINCARQMFLEEERGSIRVGKYADFLLVDKDVLTCPADEIGTARTAATYFEGKKVFSV